MKRTEEKCLELIDRANQLQAIAQSTKNKSVKKDLLDKIRSLEIEAQKIFHDEYEEH